MDLHSQSSTDSATLRAFPPKELPGRIGRLNKVDVLEHYKGDEIVSFDMKISTEAIGYLISGNHRHVVKTQIREENPQKFATSAYWSQTRTQIYVGLSKEQARYLANEDNKLSNLQIADNMVSQVQVCCFHEKRLFR